MIFHSGRYNDFGAILLSGSLWRKISFCFLPFRAAPP
jgi:hypothetical protein